VIAGAYAAYVARSPSGEVLTVRGRVSSTELGRAILVDAEFNVHDVEQDQLRPLALDEFHLYRSALRRTLATMDGDIRRVTIEGEVWKFEGGVETPLVKSWVEDNGDRWAIDAARVVWYGSDDVMRIYGYDRVEYRGILVDVELALAS
jgi:hypothetical protein